MSFRLDKGEIWETSTSSSSKSDCDMSSTWHIGSHQVGDGTMVSTDDVGRDTPAGFLLESSSLDLGRILPTQVSIVEV